MKNIYFRLLFIFCFIVPQFLKAQSSINTTSIDNGLSVNGNLADALSDRVLLNSSAINEQHGSPFWFDDWLPAKIILFDNTYFAKTIPAKLDIFRSEVRLKNDEGKEVALLPTKAMGIEFITPDGLKKTFKRFTIKENYLPYYCEVLNESDKITLVCLHSKVFRRADLVQRGVVSTGSPFDRFEQDDDIYYVRLNNKKFEPIKLTRSDFIGQFSSAQQIKLKDFCKTQLIGKRLDALGILKLCVFANSIL